MAAEAKPEKKIKECTVGKIIRRWVRAKREECLNIVDQNKEDFREKARNALDKLFKTHKIGPLESGIQDIKYEDPFFQFGYMYKHSMFSARSLSTVMHCSDVLENLGKKSSITVACLGGGPGSDVLGVLDYFTRYMGDFEGQLDIQLYDRKDKWGTCWESLETAIRAKLHDPRVRVRFHDFDVTMADKSKPDVKNADVITMHYFMEEVYSERKKEQVKKCFDHIIQTAKPGALFLYSGMYMYQVIDWVHRLLQDKCKLLTPDTEQPEQPDTEQPEQPDTEQPEPDTKQPEQPDTEQPKPDTEQPEQPDTEQPKPDTKQPEQQDTEQPKPDTEQPEQPDMEQPKPDTEQPEQPDTEQPKPDTEQPEQPDTEQPKPDTKPGQPDTEQPQRPYQDTSTGIKIKKWIPYAEVDLRQEGDLKLFDDIRENLEAEGISIEEVSQRFEGEVVYRLYKKK